MILQLYRECFILLNHVPCVSCCVYTVSKRRRKEKRNPHAIFFSDSNSTVEWRAEYWDTVTTQLEWRFKEMEGSRNRLLQPPPHRILRGRRRRRKAKTKQKSKVHSCLCPVSTIPGSSATHFPRPFSYSTRKSWFLQSRAMAAEIPRSLCLLQASFLPPSQGIPLPRLLLQRLALFYSQEVELKDPQCLLSPVLALP